MVNAPARMLFEIGVQQRDDAVEVVAAQHGDLPEHTGRGLEAQACMGGADVGQQARAVGKGGARGFAFWIRVFRHRARIALTQ
jgi:hypothetical protein